tara:strand:- start:324 stop:1154 length:831 start_codon:yes stop_codon:yes gene_type:complete
MEKSFITCELMGGLGNQLFQIFTTISYALENKINFFFPNYKGMKGIDGLSERNAYWDNLFFNLRPHIKDINGGVLVKERKSHTYSKLPAPIRNTTIVLFGYFQSLKYFSNKKDDIVNLIGFSKYQKKIGEINAVSLHFRIGDYKVNSKIHPILSVDYYKKALESIILNTEKKDWIVKYCYEEQDEMNVSEKIEYLKKQFPDLVFEKVDNKLKDWQQMLYMSCCKHNIIANSTFSWWAAYLNKNNDKIVCYPETWFGKGSGINSVSEIFEGLGWKKY